MRHRVYIGLSIFFCIAGVILLSIDVRESGETCMIFALIFFILFVGNRIKYNSNNLKKETIYYCPICNQKISFDDGYYGKYQNKSICKNCHDALRPKIDISNLDKLSLSEIRNTIGNKSIVNYAINQNVTNDITLNTRNNKIKYNKAIKPSFFSKRKLYIDEQNKVWHYEKMSRKIHFDEVISVDIIEESKNNIVTNTFGTDKKKVALGKALVGGALLGPAGAIIGGTSGKTNRQSTSVATEVEYCNCMDIVIKTSSSDIPIVKINIIPYPIEKSSLMYQKSLESAKSTLYIFESLMPNCNKVESEITEKIENNTSNIDKYDQLAKIKKLLDDDVITQEEFNQEKAKILNS